MPDNKAKCDRCGYVTDELYEHNSHISLTIEEICWECLIAMKKYWHLEG